MTTGLTLAFGTQMDPVVLLLPLSMLFQSLRLESTELNVYLCRGIGYVQELVSRLTKTLITNFDTSVNSTIVNNTVLFPLDQPIYVDASHDTILTASEHCFSSFHLVDDYQG
jgi:hypothetical protein